MNYRKGFLRVYLVLSACWIGACLFVGITKSRDLQLDESKREQLDSIVRRMMDDDESDDDIQPVVDEFKQKYGRRSWATTLRRVATSGDTLAITFLPPAIGCIAFVVVPWIRRGFGAPRADDA